MSDLKQINTNSYFDSDFGHLVSKQLDSLKNLVCTQKKNFKSRDLWGRTPRISNRGDKSPGSSTYEHPKLA